MQGAADQRVREGDLDDAGVLRAGRDGHQGPLRGPPPEGERQARQQLHLQDLERVRLPRMTIIA